MALELCCVLRDLGIPIEVSDLVLEYYVLGGSQVLVPIFEVACSNGNLERLTFLYQATQLFRRSPRLCYSSTLLAGLNIYSI